MSRWFRHYAGMMRDEKLVRAALRSKQPIERVVWIWGAILESAAEVNEDGRYDLDPAEAAYFLRADDSHVLDIIASLEENGRIHNGRVVKWGDRQFQSDTSAERQKRYRDRQKSKGDGDGRHDQEKIHRHGDGHVTSPLRHGDAPETETETETETEKKGRGALTRAGKPDSLSPREELEKVLDTEHAEGVIEHRKRLRKPLTTRAARLLAGKFQAYGDPNSAADAMIANGWQGFEPAWLENRRAHGPPSGKRNILDAAFDMMRENDEQSSNYDNHGDVEQLPADGSERRSVAPLIQGIVARHSR